MGPQADSSIQSQRGAISSSYRLGKTLGSHLPVTQIRRIPMMIPLAVGILTFACTLLVHVLPLEVTVRIARREKKLGRAGATFGNDFAVVALIILFALLAHLIEIAMWAAVFVMCGEFRDYGIAYYHSAVNYTTLGYGDLIMSPKWRLLGPLEAANGIMLFGVSTAMIFTLIQRLAQARFVDLKE